MYVHSPTPFFRCIPLVMLCVFHLMMAQIKRTRSNSHLFSPVKIYNNYIYVRCDTAGCLSIIRLLQKSQLSASRMQTLQRFFSLSSRPSARLTTTIAQARNFRRQRISSKAKISSVRTIRIFLHSSSRSASLEFADSRLVRIVRNVYGCETSFGDRSDRHMPSGQCPSSHTYSSLAPPHCDRPIELATS